MKASTGALVEFGPLGVGDYLLLGHAEGFKDVEHARAGEGRARRSSSWR